MNRLLSPNRLFLSQKLANVTKMSFQWEHNPPIPLPENAVGRFAMIRLPDYRGSMRWMRGMIVSRQKTFVEVFVIDIGGKVAMPFSSLFKVGIEWIPIPPQAFPVRLINSSLQLSPIDVNQLLWKKVNVRIESFDETDFLCDELKFYTVEKDLVDLSDIQDKKLESFIIDKEYNAGGNFDLIGGRSTNSKIRWLQEIRAVLGSIRTEIGAGAQAAAFEAARFEITVGICRKYLRFLWHQWDYALLQSQSLSLYL
ncbi:hypothetical protein RB195_009323 [Necator americanus]|uniref:Tudor domain-containing protein n=1 Tax=Necator americanus TaxID=51031 RepID=A0ABR1CSU6_NECAM